MLRPLHIAKFLLLVTLAVAIGCDSVGVNSDNDGFALEVLEITPMDSPDDAPSFQVQLKNSGSKLLRHVEIVFTLYPQTKLKSGVAVYNIPAGGIRTFNVPLLNIDQHSDYTCYRSQLIAFALDRKVAVIDRAGPETCK